MRFEIMLAIVTAVVGLLTIHVTKKNNYASIIASNRIKWVSDCRDAINAFMEVAMKSNATLVDKQVAKFKVETFIRYEKPSGESNESYERLRTALGAMVTTETPTSEEIDELLDVAQLVLGRAYDRAKAEAGVTEQMEKDASDRAKR